MHTAEGQQHSSTTHAAPSCCIAFGLPLLVAGQGQAAGLMIYLGDRLSSVVFIQEAGLRPGTLELCSAPGKHLAVALEMWSLGELA